MVFSVAIVSLLLLVSTVSAISFTGDTDAYTNPVVTVDGISLDDDVSIVAGETVTVKVWFTANESDTDVSLEVEIEGEKAETMETTNVFDVEAGKDYRKVLNLRVPYELKDEKSDSATVTIEIDGKDYKVEIEEDVNLQRPSYNADIKSVTVDSNVDAGATVPVDIVLKNRGYNDLDDVYVKVSIPALGVDKSTYFGDIVSLECSDDDDDDCDDEDAEDSASGRLYLTVPYSAKQGIYALEVEVTNDDTTSTEVVQIAINNAFPSNMIVTASSKAAAVGEEAKYEILVVNPTNKLSVFRVISGSNDDVTSSVSNAVVAVPAGSSKTVTVTARASAEGLYNFDVSVLSADNVVGTATLSLNAEGMQKTSVDAVTILTIILAIIFVVLLIVLIVLIGKKPEKAEEFGESYY